MDRASQRAIIYIPLNNINSFHSIATNYRQCIIIIDKTRKFRYLMFPKSENKERYSMGWYPKTILRNYLLQL